MIIAYLERQRFSTYAVTFGAGILQILSAILLSRVAFQEMDSGDLRIWFLMMAVWPFISLFELGANVVLPHRFAAADNDPEKTSAVASDFLAAVITFILIGGLIYALITPFTLVRTPSNVSLFSLYGMLFIAAALRVVGNALQSMLYASGDIFYDKLLRILAAVVLTGVGAAGLKCGLGLFSLPPAWAGSALLSIVLSLSRQRLHCRLRIGLNKTSRAGMLDMLSTALRYICIAVPGQLVFNATPFIIAANLPAVYTISFGLAQQLVAGISLLTSLPMTVAAPTLARLTRESQNAAGSALLNTISRSAMISLHCLLLIGLNHADILSMWTGKSIEIDPIFLAFYFGMMFMEWQQSAMTTAAMMAGNFRFVAVTTISAVLVLSTMPFFIGIWGFVGVPLSILLAQCLTCHPHNISVALRTYGLRFSRYLGVIRYPLLSSIPVVAVFHMMWYQAVSPRFTLVATCSSSLAVLAATYLYKRKTASPLLPKAAPKASI